MIYEDDLLEYSIPEILKSKLANLPTNPGIYQYKNNLGKIIYVGKAKNLRNRVRSYFQNNRPRDAKTTALLKKITDLEIIVVNSEAEALILEDTLIKKYKPRYNVMLRDDKTYPYVRITNEPFPRIFKTRKVIRDGSKYYGPYTEVRQLNSLLKLLRSVLKYRSCKLKLNETDIRNNKFKVCLDYHIKKCTGPCIGRISKVFYNDNIKTAIQILQGKTKDLENRLKSKMIEFADELRFEEAAEIRNQLELLSEYIGGQKVVTTELIDRDVIGYCRIENSACTLIFMIREGKLIGKKHFVIANALEQQDSEIIQATIEKWYMEAEIIPKEIVVPVLPEQPDFIQDWLKQKKGRTVELTEPKLGDKKKLLDLATANAEFMLREYFITIAKKDQLLSKSVLALQKDLHLPKPPIRIECFDNSHLQGTDYVSSMVCFIEGKPKKSEYKKFKLKYVDGNDDFAAMREVITRRYTRLVQENLPLPDLIIVDGGKGQLSSAIEILQQLEIFDKVTIIGLAKRLDEVFVPFESDSIMLPRNSASLKLIQQLRDEAHRFAITYHRLLRDKRTLKTELTDIKGIGEKTAEKLLKKFGSVKQIKMLTFEELKSAIGEKNSEALIEHFDINSGE